MSCQGQDQQAECLFEAWRYNAKMKYQRTDR